MAASKKDSGSKKYSPMTIALAAVGGAVVGGLGYVLVQKLMAPAPSTTTGTAPTNGAPAGTGAGTAAGTAPSGQVFLRSQLDPQGLAFNQLGGTVRSAGQVFVDAPTSPQGLAFGKNVSTVR